MNIDFDYLRHLVVMMMTAFGIVGVPLPLPLPPQPEDPALVRVAPKDALLFVEWFGAAAPAAGATAPTNRSEQLAGEPEIRTMVAQLLAATRTMALQQAPEDDRVDGAALFDALVEAPQRPGCAFVTQLDPLAAGVVTRAGDRAIGITASLDRWLEAQATKGMRTDRQTVDGVEFRGPRVRDTDPFVGWATVDGYVAFAIGDGTAAQIVAGLRGTDPGLGGGVLRDLRKEAHVERPVLRTFAAVERLAAKLRYTSLWSSLGLDHVSAALAESGLDGDAFAVQLQLASAVPGGLLGELRGRPLSVDDLALVPNDATFALAVRGGERGFERLLLATLKLLAGERAERHWQDFLEHAQGASGVNVRDDLIAHVDDCAVAWSSPEQGGIGFTGLVAAVPLRDGKAFDERLVAMWEKMEGVAPNKANERAKGNRLHHAAYLERLPLAGQRAWWVDLIDDDVPFGFTWTSTSSHFLFGLLPQPVRCASDASRAPNFDKALVRTPLVARRGDATALFYLDVASLLRQGYGAGLLLFQVGSLEWQREGFDFDLADVPRLEVLLRHVGPELVTLAANPSGFHVTRRGSLPVFDPLLATCATACLMTIE